MEFKVVVLGSAGTGKTRFIDDVASFGEILAKHPPASGITLTSIKFMTNIGAVIFNVWDFSPNCKCEDKTQHCRDTDACIALLKFGPNFDRSFSCEFGKIIPVAELIYGLDPKSVMGSFSQIAKILISPDVVMVQSSNNKDKYNNIHNETTNVQYISSNNNKVKITTRAASELVT